MKKNHTISAESTKSNCENCEPDFQPNGAKATHQQTDLKYPCPNPFSQIYLIPRKCVDIRFCSYHKPVLFRSEDVPFNQGIARFDQIFNQNEALKAVREKFIQRDFQGAGCVESCVWYSRWKTTGQGYSIEDYTDPAGNYSFKSLWLSVGPDCNITCRYCLQPSEYVIDFNSCNPQVMELARDFVQRGGELLLTGGETFLPKWGFATMLEQLIEKGDAKGQISLHTNGVYLKKNIRDILLRAPVTTVGISMDTLRKELFEYLRRGAQFEDVWNNARNLVKERNAQNRTVPAVVLLAAVTKSTAGHILETVDRAVNEGLGISFNALFQAYYSPEFSREEGLHNLNPHQLQTLLNDVHKIEEKYGENGPVNYQSIKGQLLNLIENQQQGKTGQQVILGGGGHAPRKAYFILLETAEYYIQQHAFAQAKILLQKILVKEPRATKVLNNLVVIAILEKEFTEAQKYIDQVLKLDPRNECALENQATLRQIIQEQIDPVGNQVAADNAEVCQSTGTCCSFCGHGSGTLLYKCFDKFQTPVEMFQCQNCRAIFPNYELDHAKPSMLPLQIQHVDDVWPEMSPAEADELAADLEEKIVNYYQPQIEAIKSDDYIVEIGTGRGGLARALVNRNYKFIGCEPSPHLFKMSQQVYNFTDAELKNHDADTFLQHLEETGIRAKVVFMWHVLEHINQPMPILKRVRNLLSDNGLIIAQIPLIAREYIYPEHLHFLNESTLAFAAHQCGFEITDLNYDFNLDFMAFNFKKSTKVAANASHPEKITTVHPPDLLLRERESEIRLLKSTCQTKDAKITELDALSRNREEMIQKLDLICRERETTINKLDSVCREREKIIQNLHNQLKGKDNEILELDILLNQN